MGMKVICETDTGIMKEYFDTPSWGEDADPTPYYVIRCKRSHLPYVLQNLEEWCRQIKEELGHDES